MLVTTHVCKRGERERTIPVHYGETSATVGDTRDPSRIIRNYSNSKYEK